MKELFLTQLSQALNAYLQLDAESNSRLAALEGKVVSLELLPFHFTFQCLFSKQRVVIQQDPTLSADTTIRGTPLQMLHIMLDKNDRQRFFAEDVVMEGNAEIGQQVIELFDNLQINWEEPLARLIGDVPTHYVSQFRQRLHTWLRSTGETLAENVDEFIHEEAKWLPAREALQDLFEEIDTLRMDVDRAAEKIKQLHKQLTDNKENP